MESQLILDTSCDCSVPPVILSSGLVILSSGLVILSSGPVIMSSAPVILSVSEESLP